MFMIFSDIDGTLYDKDCVISPELLTTIKKAKDSSIMFNLATGNPLVPALINLGKKLSARYLICSNGACIYDLMNNKTIFENCVAAETANKILSITTKLNMGAIWWTNNHIYNSKLVNYKLIELIESSLDKKGPRLITSDSITENIYKIEIYDYDENKESKNELITELKKLNVNVLERPENGFIEINQFNISKWEAIQYIAKLHNMDPKNSMTIGNSDNDKSMLLNSDFSYVVADANQEIKESAKFHTSACNQNGVGMAIIDYLHRTRKIISNLENDLKERNA